MSWHIIEGPDDTGKTTLAKQFEQLGYRYEHAGATDTLPILAQRMAKLQDLSHVVWDRAHLGEIVHAPLDRGYSVSLGWWRLIEAFLLEKQVQPVLLRVRRGESDQWENDQLRQQLLVERFDQAELNSVLSWRFVAPTPRPPSFGIEPHIDREGLGGLADGSRPIAWILGEQESSKSLVPWPFATRCGIELIWPAVNPRNVRISNVLARLPEQKLDPGYLNYRWESLGRPPVIALGNSVERWCLSAEVPVFTKLPHPQWHLRFHASETQRYIYLLGVSILRATKEGVVLALPT